MACRTCGCGGHGPTYEVACTLCGETRWPRLSAPPDPRTYVCARCRMTPAGKRERRAEGAAKRRATLAGKGHQTRQDSPGDGPEAA